MLRRLKTKYIDFINEENLYVKDINKVIRSMARNNIIASLLVILEDVGNQHYRDDSQINYISLSDTFNTLNYLPKNKRTNDLEKNFSSDITGKVEIRIGRMIKRILSDVDKSKFKLNYKGKIVIESYNNRTNLIFDKKLTGDEFAKLYENEYFFISSEGDPHDKANNLTTDVKLMVDGKEFMSRVFDINDNCYKADWDSAGVYFEMTLSDKLSIGSDKDLDDEPTSYSRKYIYDCELQLMNKFGKKSIEEINDSDIEKFVNELTAELKLLRSSPDSKIEIVKGKEIKKWYDSDNYQSTSGQLGSSCMSGKLCQLYFDIYTENSDTISLLILKNEGDKLVGRALLWKLENGKYFMDRVYCSTEYDEKIFTKYANENGYYYRNNGNNNYIHLYLNCEEKKEDFDKLVVSVPNCDFDNYPYLDTLKFLDLSNDVLVYSNGKYAWDRELRDTEGKWTEYYEENETDYGYEEEEELNGDDE